MNLKNFQTSSFIVLDFTVIGVDFYILMVKCFQEILESNIS